MNGNKAIGFMENALTLAVWIGLGVLLAPVLIAAAFFCLPLIAIGALVLVATTAFAAHTVANAADDAAQEMEEYVHVVDDYETIDLNHNDWK